jgi:hypothetical protein
MGKKKGKIINCLNCGIEFYVPLYRIEAGAKYCSRVCSISTCFKKGVLPWNTGIKTGKIPKTAFKKGEHFSQNTEFKKGHTPCNWKGENVGYFSLHNWVGRHKGKAKICSCCGSVKNVQWANKSLEYKRDLEDWIELCYKCHRKYDRENGWGKATKKYKYLSRK